MKPRSKKCRAASCRQWFRPWNSMQKACSASCALEIARQEKAKQQRKEDQVRKQRLKSRSDVLKEAQRAFNAWVKERDHGRPCISCGAWPNDSDLLTGSRFDAGHYRSTGSCPELRFEPLNCHAQCVTCNRHLSGNTVEYRIGLIHRIGQANVDWLEGPHEPANLSKADLESIRDEYRRKARELAQWRRAA